MTKLAIRNSSNGIPFIHFGNGLYKLAILHGGPGDDLPSDQKRVEKIINAYQLFTKHYNVYILGRKSCQQPGYSTRDMALDFGNMISDEIGGPIDIIGYSFGGLISQYLASYYPELVHCLVIAASAYKVSQAGKDLDSKIAKFESQGRWGEAYATEASVYYQGLNKFIYKLLVRLKDGMNRYRPAKSPSDYLIEAEAEVNHYSLNELPRIKARTLVIAGNKDYYFPIDLIRETAAKIPEAELILYEGLGHGVCFRKQFNEDILAFLTRAS